MLALTGKRPEGIFEKLKTILHVIEKIEIKREGEKGKNYV